MTVQMLKGKIHRATVKQAELNYVGSITVDADLLDAAGIYEYEKVAIVEWFPCRDLVIRKSLRIWKENIRWKKQCAF